MSRSDWTVEDVAGLLRDGEGKVHPCCLLIGAGASLSAGIPLGAGFVAKIKELHPQAYARAKRTNGDSEPDYGNCMAEIGEANRADLVRKFVDEAKTNWAHIGIGRLERAGIVDRILTTNFDPLASRACALFNRFPAVYDLAALRDDDGEGRNARFIPAFVKGSAIYHLHGQHTGFLLLNTTELLEQQADRVEQALREAMGGRVVIVCGYSGENDPLVTRIARMGAFPHKLIWVRHDEADPCGTVCDTLIDRFQDCHVVRGMGADQFFTELANNLKLPQPEFLIDPFAHMLAVLEEIRPYNTLDQRGVDLLEQGREMLRQAARTQQQKAPDQSDIARLMGEERYADVWAQFGAGASERNEAERDLIAWAAIMEGNGLSGQAKQKHGAEADALFAQAGEKYAAALAIKPDSHVALYNWGNALSYQAERKHRAEADALFAQASEKYAAALAIKPDKHEALYNWGVALFAQAEQKLGAQADVLFAQASEKYAAALAIKPDKHEALYNWGVALFAQAKQKLGAQADALFAQAGEKYAAALAIKPDDQEALNNWGVALSDQGKQKQGAEADTLFAQAGEKYAAALAIKPDDHEALSNWGVALSDQAKQKQGAEADTLFAQAGEKYAAALAIKPDDHEALNNWGVALSDQAKQKQGAEADTLFAQAGEKYAAALAIKPDDHEALTNWGGALLGQAKGKQGAEADALFAQSEEILLRVEAIKEGRGSYNLACVEAQRGNIAAAIKWLRLGKDKSSVFPDCAHIAADSDFDRIRDEPEFRKVLTELGC